MSQQQTTTQLYTEADVLAWKHTELNDLPKEERDLLPVTWVKTKTWHVDVLSTYGDPVWHYPSHRFQKSTPASNQKINWSNIHSCFVDVIKMVMRDYDCKMNPAGSTLGSQFIHIRMLLTYLTDIGVTQLSAITPLHCANYVQHVKTLPGTKGKTISSGSMRQKFLAVEFLYEALRKTAHAFEHPWPDSSACALAGVSNRGGRKAKTEIIPDDVLSALMQPAVAYLERADELFALREQVEETRETLLKAGCKKSNINGKLNALLDDAGYEGILTFNKELIYLQSACMIIILSLSGIRLHELVSIKNKSWYRTTNDEGETLYWMRGRSDKTGEGDCEWLVPGLVTRVLDVAETYAKPLQALMPEQIELLRAQTVKNNEWHVLEAMTENIFLGQTRHKNSQVNCLTGQAIIIRINNFAKVLGLSLHLTPHMFRRTFAVYVAKSAFGDLRYLKQHFKHWSLDMTILYALNEQQDSELYDEIMVAMVDEKIARVSHWLEQDTLLSGGGAEPIRMFRTKNDSVTTYEDRRAMAEKISDSVFLRASGSAWCTADTGGCVGRGVAENTRCGICEHGVVDDAYQNIWPAIYSQQLELRDIPDIGEAGRARVERDIKRCEQVLEDLGLIEVCKKAVEKDD